MFPFLHLWGRAIPVYGLCMATGILVSSFCAYFRQKRRGVMADENDFIITAACTFGFGLTGAKLMYIFASYGISNFWRDLRQGDLRALMEGGQVYYGGLIFGACTAVVLVRLFHADLGLFCEAAVPCVPLGHAFGRIGCGFAGCCYGIPYDGFGAVHIPLADGRTTSLFPVQFVEAGLNFLLFLGLAAWTRKRHTGFHTLTCYLCCYGVLRFALEYLRGDGIRGGFLLFSTAQWTSIVLILAALLAEGVLFYRSRRTAA